MIELRTYEGEAAELSAFAQRVWGNTYEGRMMLPRWSAQYFDWQLLANRPGGRDYLVAAYDGSRLIGSLLGEGFRFSLHGREFDATMGSWLTVDPEYRRQGVGTLLFEEQKRRHLDRGAIFHLGYGYVGAADSMGPKFWNSFPANTVNLGRVGFWARVFDHEAVSRWDLSWFDRWGAWALGFSQQRRPAPADTTGIRPYRAEDLPACVELSHGLLDRVDLGYVWSAERLAHQLAYGDMPRTLVYEQGGKVQGFINFYLMDFVARFPLRAAMIDLMAFGAMPSAARHNLLRAAMAQMVDEGAKLALTLKLPCYPRWPMWRNGFMPLPRDFYLICVRMDTSFPLDGARKVHLHWR